jgi:hypothetical protein
VFTIRTMGGIALLVFGSTFLWVTPEFASPDVATTGALWSITRVLALVTLLGFTVATWGLFQRASWWEVTAIAAAILGVVAMIPFWVAANHAGETTPGFTVLIHLVGSAGVLILLLVPPLERWVDSHVMSG